MAVTIIEMDVSQNIPTAGILQVPAVAYSRRVVIEHLPLIPENHLLRKIDRMVSFGSVYDLLAPYYPATGRPSVDPVSMFKMLLVGYILECYEQGIIVYPVMCFA